jgi:hypothetical protein
MTGGLLAGQPVSLNITAVAYLILSALGVSSPLEAVGA